MMFIFSLGALTLATAGLSTTAHAWSSCEYQANNINNTMLPDWRNTRSNAQRKNIIKHIGYMVIQGCESRLYSEASKEIGCGDSQCSSERQEYGYESGTSESTPPSSSTLDKGVVQTIVSGTRTGGLDAGTF
jgi:hypothetical protein